MIKTVVLTGSRGNLGQTFTDFLKKEYPDYKVINLLPFPFSLEKIHSVLSSTKVDYFINCAALTFNSDSYSKPFEFFQTNTWGVLNQIEMIRKHSKNTRYLTFGTVYEQSHISPYASSKRVAREVIHCYRNNYGIYATQVTLGHTESKYRSDKRFLVSKIASKIADIKKSILNSKSFDIIELSNIDEKFNFLSTEDVVDGCWKALNQEKYKGIPAGLTETDNIARYIKDYSFNSRDENSIRHILEIAFEESGIRFLFKDSDLHFKWRRDQKDDSEYYVLNGTIEKNQQQYHVEFPLVRAVNTNEIFISLNKFIPDSHNAEKDLDWRQKTSFEEIIRDIVKTEINKI